MSAIIDDNKRTFNVNTAPTRFLEFNGTQIVIVNVTATTGETVRYIFWYNSPFALVQFVNFTNTANDGVWLQSNMISTVEYIKYRNSNDTFTNKTGADQVGNAYGMWVESNTAISEGLGLIWNNTLETQNQTHTYARASTGDDPQTCWPASAWCDANPNANNMLGNFSKLTWLKMGMINVTTSAMNATYYRESNPLQVAIGAAESQTPTCPISINNCSVLDTANCTYLLTANITDSANTTCMNITANNVILDCQGYMIGGQNNISTYGVDIERSILTPVNVTVSNCIIRNWWRGILNIYANGVLIFNNTVNGTLKDYGDSIDM
jgi:hypothetical protein